MTFSTLFGFPCPLTGILYPLRAGVSVAEIPWGLPIVAPDVGAFYLCLILVSAQQVCKMARLCKFSSVDTPLSSGPGGTLLLVASGHSWDEVTESVSWLARMGML